MVGGEIAKDIAIVVIESQHERTIYLDPVIVQQAHPAGWPPPKLNVTAATPGVGTGPASTSNASPSPTSPSEPNRSGTRMSMAHGIA